MLSRKYDVSFECLACKDKAQMVEIDGRLDHVYCTPCGVLVDSPDAILMYQTLIERHRLQVGRNISRRIVSKSGMGRVPSSKIDNEFSDSRWPFILKIKDDR